MKWAIIKVVYTAISRGKGRRGLNVLLRHTKRPQRGAACMHKDKQPDFICSLLNGLNGSEADSPDVLRDVWWVLEGAGGWLPRGT